MDNIIDGRAIAAKREELLLKKIKKLKNQPKLVSILIGDDPASIIYTNMKKRKAESLGLSFELIKFEEDAKYSDVSSTFKDLNKDRTVHGIMVQMPCPYPEIALEISPKKDVDGLNPKSKKLPATVKGILSLLDAEKIDVKGKIVTVIGASPQLGLPLADQLKKRKAIVTVCDINTKDLKDQTLKAEIIFSVAGEPDLLIGRMVTEGVIVIDVGTTRIDNKVVGDVDFESVSPKASKITPVPGGVGPMTIISLMESLVETAT